ncbi:MAG: PAS domain-containing sensor histidine kinase [Pseudomonadota bacterium]
MIRSREASGARQGRASSPRRAKRAARQGAHDADGETLRPTTVLLAVGAFVAVFALLIAVKLNQEHEAALSTALDTQARSAAFLAERVSSRLGETRGALALTAGELSLVRSGRSQALIGDRLEALTRSGYVTGAALLTPSADPQIAGDFPESLSAAADAALADPSGLAAMVDEAPVWIAAAAPVRLSENAVGALVLRIDPSALLPERGDGQMSILTDQSGRALASHPPANLAGAPYAASQIGLEPARAAVLARNGGALSGEDRNGVEHVLGLAALPDAPLQTYTLTNSSMDAAAWRRTVVFYLLLGLGPLIVAVGLCALLLHHMSKLRATKVQLADSERRFRLAIEGARCGVWDWDIDNDAVYITDSMARMLGRTAGESLSGALFLGLLSNDDRGKLRTALNSADDGEPLDVEIRASQVPVWMQMRGRPFPSPDGSGRRMVGVAIDITERKGAQARVAAAETRLRAALESMTESFVLWDSRRRLVLWNRKFREFFGFPDGQLKPGISYNAVEAAAGRAIFAAHASSYGETEGAFELELKDGRWLHYSERRTAEGGLVSVGADITALKDQEQTLVRSESDLKQTVLDLELSREQIQELATKYEQEKIRAEEANRSKSEFLANMSHELRTPLNAINGFSEIMLQEMFGPLGDEKYKGYVGDILSSGQHLLSLINDILDMSKIEAGKMNLQPEMVLPGDLIEQCLRLMRARAEEKQIMLRAEGADLPEIEADPRAIKQVLLNLMSNAVKFTPDGGRVVVRGFDAADGVVLQVADSGIGIPEDDLPRLGRAFEQIESHHAKSHQGSGLGLALSKSLVELHGGTLRIDSVLGKGTTVSFTLPARARIQQGDEAEAVEQTGSDETGAPFTATEDDAA